MSVILSRGDIVLVRFPFTDLAGSSLRPALVISKEQIGQDVILAAISSVVRDSSISSDHVIDIEHPEFKLTGLRVTSVFRLHKLATVERSKITRRIGHIGPQLQSEVDKILRQILGL